MSLKTRLQGENKLVAEFFLSERLIKVNATTRNEFTNSQYAKRTERINRTIYADKFKTSGQLDEIVLASTNYINEDLKHERSDNYKEFARGDVLLRIGESEYSAKVIIGFTKGNQMELYDVIDFIPTELILKTKKTGLRTVQSENPKNHRQAKPVSTTNIPQNPKMSTPKPKIIKKRFPCALLGQ